MNGIQVTKPSGRQWNRLLDAVVTVLKYKVVRHCANMSSHIQGINFDKSYSPVSRAEFFRINISIADMHRLTYRVLVVRNVFWNTNDPINERVYVSQLPYYLDWFEKYYFSVPFNLY